MKTEKNILIAFLLNLAFSVFEFVGGLLTGSVAIVSDGVHDLGDAISIGVSYFFEKKSKKPADAVYTYGYGRYAVVGSVITTSVLLIGSVLVIYNALRKMVTPTPVHYDGMIFFALVGIAVNLVAAFCTRRGESLNQKAVNLHMLEDVLGWLVVLVGAVVMKFTDFLLLDPLMSLGVALFILLHAFSHLREAWNLFLEKTPEGVDIEGLRKDLMQIEGVLSVHHLHLWSIDGKTGYATLHVIPQGNTHEVKEDLREVFLKHGFGHVTLELEEEGENCEEKNCRPAPVSLCTHAHHR